MHIGCAEVIGGARVRAFRDLAGRKVAIGAENDIPHIFFSLLGAYIGMDPRLDSEWTPMPHDQWGMALPEACELLRSTTTRAFALPPDFAA